MAAGLGTRMRTDVPKHRHPVLGRRMVDWVPSMRLSEAGADPIVVVAAPQTRDGFEGYEVAVQEQPLGTGDAVRAARSAVEGRADHVLVLSGDAVLLTEEMLRDLVGVHLESGAAATVLGIEYEDARSYGRLVRGEDGALCSESSRPATRARRSWGSARGTRRSTSSSRRSSGPRSSGSRRRTPRASSTSPMRSGCWSPTASWSQ